MQKRKPTSQGNGKAGMIKNRACYYTEFRRKIKKMIVFLGVRDLLSEGVATWLVKRGGLAND